MRAIYTNIYIHNNNYNSVFSVNSYVSGEEKFGVVDGSLLSSSVITLKLFN